nr:BREX system P-loop protein BrxC [Actinomycetota bacterium]
MTSLANRDVFARDPLENRLPNDGVAKIGEPSTPEDWDVLRYELSTFVCDGEYRRGLETILDTYLKNLGMATQPAVWVSGFYGSGKSHLVRVLEFLWRDVRFPDGATARSVAQLPDSVSDMLRELDTAGRRAGGLWSAAGTLGSSAGDSVRLGILGIVFAAAGLPSHYAQGRFVLWLKQSGFYEGVKVAVEAEGKDFRRELSNLYVSPYLARALLSVYPDFAGGAAEARALIRAQYPSPDDISDEEMLDAMTGILELGSDASGTPCALLVLDELQQYIGDNADRTLRVQNVVEACSSRFQGRLLFVATGQSALQATPQLQKLQGRFTVRVSLSDADVEEVVRRVVLRKDQTRRGELEAVLEDNAGEIDRHLAETKIRPTEADRPVLVADYPLLPVRRRFWERVLRAIDRAGAAGQLRTQLRIVQEAAQEVALREVGNVVPADFVYGQLSASMLQTGVLLREVDETIRAQGDGTEDGELRRRLCALIFLIGQLPRDAGSDTGLRASPRTLADLVVEDIREGSAALRGRIPGLLEGMVEGGQLMFVDDEYRLQTREGSEWTAAYQGARARIFGDDARIAGDRSRELREAVGRTLKGLSFVQGESKTPRKAELHFGSEMPNASSGAVSVWVRDEWAVSEKQARAEAQAAGGESPVVHVFLPKRSAEELKAALAAYEAASEVLSSSPVPTTQEGQEAR